MTDNVNNPKHYTSHPSGIECIQITEHMNFNVGNAIKYLWRTDHKNGLEDLKKARWYVDREIERVGGNNTLIVVNSLLTDDNNHDAFLDIIHRRVDTLELSERSKNALKKNKLYTLAEMSSTGEADMLRISNFGRKSLNECKGELKNYGLTFGMDLTPFGFRKRKWDWKSYSIVEYDY